MNKKELRTHWVERMDDSQLIMFALAHQISYITKRIDDKVSGPIFKVPAPWSDIGRLDREWNDELVDIVYKELMKRSKEGSGKWPI